MLIINKFTLPKELNDIIKDYIFNRIKKINNIDTIYRNIATIPKTIYDDDDKDDLHSYIYLIINWGVNWEKEYFIVYKKFETQIQTLIYYENENLIKGIEGNVYSYTH